MLAISIDIIKHFSVGKKCTYKWNVQKGMRQCDENVINFHAYLIRKNGIAKFHLPDRYVKKCFAIL